MKILVGSKNAGKIEACKLAFEHYFDNIEIEGISVSSDVPDQPINEEVFNGAKNRVNNLVKYAKENNIDADYYAAVESGLTNQLGDYVITNIAFIQDANGNNSYGVGASFPVPYHLIEEIKRTNLTQVFAKIYNIPLVDVPRTGKGGVSSLTKKVLTRIDVSEQAFIMALTKFINEEWKDEKKVLLTE